MWYCGHVSKSRSLQGKINGAERQVRLRAGAHEEHRAIRAVADNENQDNDLKKKMEELQQAISLCKSFQVLMASAQKRQRL